MKDIEKMVSRSVKMIKKYVKEKPETGLILGSGLGIIADAFEDKKEIPYKKIPYFPASTVPGHSNMLVFGKYKNMDVVLMKGRFHFYEGFTMQEITYPVRVLKELGVKRLIITNAAGGVNRKFKVGDLMIIEDHINLMGENPLRGWSREEIAPRFVDMTFAYSPELIKIALKAAKKIGIKVQRGVYAAMRGPSYETPAEIRMLSIIKADAVGMSTVPEVIVANQLGIKVLGISLITNLAAGILKKPLSHEEVMEASEKAKDKFVKFIKEILNNLK